MDPDTDGATSTPSAAASAAVSNVASPNMGVAALDVIAPLTAYFRRVVPALTDVDDAAVDTLLSGREAQERLRVFGTDAQRPCIVFVATATDSQGAAKRQGSGRGATHWLTRAWPGRSGRGSARGQRWRRAR